MTGNIVRTYGQGIRIIDGDSVFAADAAVGSGAAGVDLTLTAGAGDGAGDGGTVNIVAGNATTGDGGSVIIQAGDISANPGRGGDIILLVPPNDALSGALISRTTGAGEAGTGYDSGDVVIDTVPLEAGTGWCQRTLVFEGTGASVNTVLLFAEPNTNGVSLKVRVWATAVDLADPDSQMTQIRESVFYRDGGSAISLLGALRNDQIVTGGGAGGASISLAISGAGEPVVRANIDDVGVNVRFVFHIEYQYSGT